MKLLLAVAVAAVVAFAVPARADTMVETASFFGTGEGGIDFVRGPLFDPALGTLVSVTASVEGQYFADIFTDSPGVPTHLNFALDGSFMAPGISVSDNVGSFTADYIGQRYVGRVGFAFSDSISAFGDYVEGSPDATPYLAALGVYAVSPVPLGAPSDFSTWSGDLTITYCYDPASPVPEPGSLAMLALRSRFCWVEARKQGLLF